MVATRSRWPAIRQRSQAGLEELHEALVGCLESYTASFGTDAAEITLQPSRIHLSVREEQDGKWEQSARVDISAVLSIPGFQIEHGNEPVIIEFNKVVKCIIIQKTYLFSFVYYFHR